MGDRFDELAKDAAADLPRRELFRRIGGGLLGIVLASVGLAARDRFNCAEQCAVCCNAFDFRPRSQEHAQCIRDCHEGRGVCGPRVCPEGLPPEPSGGTVTGAAPAAR